MALDSMIYGTDYIATHSFEEDTKTKHVERVAPASGILGGWDDSYYVSSTGLTNITADTTGRGRIVLGVLCKGSDTPSKEIKFRLVFYNSNGVIIGASAEVSSLITNILKEFTTNEYYGTLTVFSNDAGASSVGIYVTSTPAGAMGTYLYLAAL